MKRITWLCLFICAVAVSTAQTRDINELREKADQGEAESQYLLGLRYEEGNDIAKDLSLAVYWYDRAAMQNYIKAKDKLDSLRIHDFFFYSYSNIEGKVSGVGKYIIRFDFKSQPNTLIIKVLSIEYDDDWNESLKSLESHTIKPSSSALIEGTDHVKIYMSDTDCLFTLAKGVRYFDIVQFKNDEINNVKCYTNDISDIYVEPDEIAKLSIKSKENYFKEKSSIIIRELKKLPWVRSKSIDLQIFKNE